jgi:hypothetical protein
MDFDTFDDDLRRIEGELEQKARECCSAKGGQETWCALNRALVELRSAISSVYKMAIAESED